MKRKKSTVDNDAQSGADRTVAITCRTADSLPLDKIVAFQGDLKTLSTTEFEKLKKSIIKYGLSFPSFVWQKNGSAKCLDGHQRSRVLAEMKKEGWKVPPIPVVYVKAKNEKEAKEKVLLLSSQYGHYTPESLYEFIEMSGLDFPDLSGLVDLPQVDLDKFRRSFYEDEVNEGPEPQFDKATELRNQYGVELGQVWQLGDHRLMCGDATKREDVDRLMEDKKAEVTFTSPPYNMGDNATLGANDYLIDSKYRAGIKDDLSMVEYENLLTEFTRLSLNVSTTVFVNIQLLARNKLSLIDYLYKWRDHLADIAIWDKQQASPSMAPRVMNAQFEFILVFSKHPTRAIGSADWRGTVSNVYSAPPQRNNEFSKIHAATFPIHLPTWVIATFSRTRDNILDPFLGSGTTLIACEQLTRRCCAMEISPEYTAVSIQRWVDLTGKEPKLL